MESNQKKYNIVELIEILTGYIGDLELQFLKQVEDAGLTAKMLTYLNEIHKKGHPTSTELACALGLSKPSITAIVDKLEKLGYIEKIQSDEDRRSAHIHLTEKGRELAKTHDEAHRNMADIFTENLNKKDLNTLETILNKAIQKMTSSANR